MSDTTNFEYDLLQTISKYYPMQEHTFTAKEYLKRIHITRRRHLSFFNTLFERIWAPLDISTEAVIPNRVYTLWLVFNMLEPDYKFIESELTAVTVVKLCLFIIKYSSGGRLIIRWVKRCCVFCLFKTRFQKANKTASSHRYYYCNYKNKHFY